MRIVTHLFGPLAEQAGVCRLELQVEGGTVQCALGALRAAVPKLKIDATVRFAINATYAGADAPLQEGDSLALIPPVGGG